jgi:hypothetical protein
MFRVALSLASRIVDSYVGTQRIWVNVTPNGDGMSKYDGGEGKYLHCLWRSIPVNISSHCWGLEVLLHLFWSSLLDGYKWSTPRLAPFICGCVSPKFELLALKRRISCFCRDSNGVFLVFQPADRSLYWQTYCDTLYCSGHWLNQEWEKFLMANPWAFI